jgi:hypothetical protein
MKKKQMYFGFEVPFEPTDNSVLLREAEIDDRLYIGSLCGLSELLSVLDNLHEPSFLAIGLRQRVA